MWRYSTDDKVDVMRDENGEILSSKSYREDGSLHREYSKDENGNKHYKEYDDQGNVKFIRDVNKDGSERGWQREPMGFSKTWNKNADGSGSSTNFYKGSKCGGSETDKDGNETSWGV